MVFNVCSWCPGRSWRTFPVDWDHQGNSARFFIHSKSNNAILVTLIAHTEPGGKYLNFRFYRKFSLLLSFDCLPTHLKYIRTDNERNYLIFRYFWGIQNSEYVSILRNHYNVK